MLSEKLEITPTSLFAAAMSALEQPATQATSQACAAVFAFLGLILPRVPNGILRAKFVGCTSVIGKALEAHRLQAGAARSGILCLGQVLCALDPTNWPAAVSPFTLLLSFTLDERPKVRKQSHTSTFELTASLQRTPSLGPCSEAILGLCKVILPGPEAAARSAASSSNKNRQAAEIIITKAVADALHLLGLLKSCIGLLPSQSSKLIVDLILKLYPLKQALLSRQATEVITKLCSSSLSSSPSSSFEGGLSPSTLSELLKVVLEGMDGPGSEESGLIDRRDPDSVLGVTRLLESGMLTLAKSDQALCTSHLPRVFHALVPHMTAEQDGVRFGTSQALRNLIVDCMDDKMIAKGIAGSAHGSKSAPAVLSVIAAVTGTLGARYEEVWPLSLAVAGTLIERLGQHPAGPSLSHSVLKCIGDILEGAQEAAEEDEERDGLLATAAGAGGAGGIRAAAEAALGCALRSLGPSVVLQTLPLNLQDALNLNPSPASSESQPRTWLLPLLRKYVQGAELGFWGKTMFPLAKEMAARSESAAATGGAGARLVQACHLLELQVWACLPSFCSWAMDLPSSYAMYVKDIAGAFQNRDDLRPCISQALERMCSQVMKVLKQAGRVDLVGEAHGEGAGDGKGGAHHVGYGSDDDDDDGLDDEDDQEDDMIGVQPDVYNAQVAEGALTALRQFSKNWLVLLFKVFLDQPPHARGPTASCISAYATLTKQEVLAPLFRSVVTKLVKIIEDSSAMDVSTDAAPSLDTIQEGGLDPTQRRCSFLELALCCAPGLNDAGLLTLFKAGRSGLSHAEPSVQKKSYKVLAYLCEQRPMFIRDHLKDVLQAIGSGGGATGEGQGGTNKGAASASRRFRLRCLQPLVILLASPSSGSLDLGLPKEDEEDMSDEDEEEGEGGEASSQERRKAHIIVNLVSEIVLCTKESNNKTRATAYELLVNMAHEMDRNEPADEIDGDPMSRDEEDHRSGGLHRLFDIVMAGLVGSTPHMQSAAVMALARLLYEFAGKLHTSASRLMPAVLMLLRTKSREVVKSVLGFIKVCAMRMPVDVLTPQLGAILEGLLLWAEDSKNKFKLKVRVVVERLARRCGFDTLAAVIPESDSHLLRHIRKQNNRKMRKRSGAESDEGDEGDDEEERGGGRGGGDARSTRSALTSGRGKGGAMSVSGKTARASEWGHSRIFGGDEEDEEDGGPGLGRGGKARSQKSKGDRGGGVRLTESGDPMDLLSPSAARQLAKRSSASNGRGRQEENEGPDAGFRRDPSGSGKLLIDEEGENVTRRGGYGGSAGGAKKRRREDEDEINSQDSDFDDLRGVADLKRAMKIAGQSPSLAKSVALGAKSLGGRSQSGKSMGGRSSGATSAGGASRQSAGGRKAPTRHSGDRFKPKKRATGGDTAGKSKVEPYAYWSFDRSMLNRRKAKHVGATKSLEKIVIAKGAARGAKAKRLEKGGKSRGMVETKP